MGMLRFWNVFNWIGWNIPKLFVYGEFPVSDRDKPLTVSWHCLNQGKPLENTFWAVSGHFLIIQCINKLRREKKGIEEDYHRTLFRITKVVNWHQLVTFLYVSFPSGSNIGESVLYIGQHGKKEKKNATIKAINLI